MSEHLLSLMTFFPILGMLIVLMLPKNNGGLHSQTPPSYKLYCIPSGHSNLHVVLK